MKTSSYQTRLGTFPFWPKEKPSASTLARAGFYYFGLDDMVKCPYCGVTLYGFEKDDSPAIDHLEASPNCSFVKAGYLDHYNENFDVCGNVTVTTPPATSSIKQEKNANASTTPASPEEPIWNMIPGICKEINPFLSFCYHILVIWLLILFIRSMGK